MMIAYTIFDKPLDYPENVVLRKFIIKCGEVIPTNEIHVCKSIDEARKFISYGLHRFDRHVNDPFAIVETWL
jgi:hypothetical protein